MSYANSHNKPSQITKDSEKSTGNKFATLPYHILFNDDLLPLSKLIMVVLLSHKSGYVIHKSVTQYQLNLSKYAFNKSWKELQHYGYITKVGVQGGVQWNVDANPTNITDWKGNAEEELVKYIKKDLLK